MDDQREPGQELDPSSAALTQALRMLSKRDYSEAEMQMRLSRRGYSVEQISFALDRLKEAGYLDEHRYAQRKAVDSRQVQIVGRRRAMEDLQKRQIAQPVILEDLGRGESAVLGHGGDEERVDAVDLGLQARRRPRRTGGRAG